MKDEIKEIIESSRKIIKSNRENDFDRIIMLGDDIDKLLDYITNLQTIEQQYSAILSENTELENKITNLQEENEKLKNGYCDLKVKCNNGECDCTNEEYEGMVQANMKGSLLLEDCKSRNEKALEKIDNLIEIEKGMGNYDKFFSDYEIKKLNDIKSTLQGEDKDD